MEIKCDICGTINDGSTNFCKGCFQKLDAERKQNVAPEETNVASVIENEKVEEVPWNNDAEVENSVPSVTPEVENWEPLSVNGDPIKKEEPVEEVSEKQPTEEVVEAEETSAEVVTENAEQQTEEPVTENTEEIVEDITPEIQNPDEVSATPSEEEKVTEKNSEEVAEDVTPEVQGDLEEGSAEPAETVSEEFDDSWSVDGETEEAVPVEPTEGTENQEEIIEPISELDESMVIHPPIPELAEEPKAEPKAEESDDWSKDPVEEIEEVKKEPKFILRFAIIYLISMIVVFGTLILTTKYLDKLFADDATSDIVSFAIYRLASLFTLIFSTFITFRKKAPSFDKLNSVTFKILGFIAIPSILVQLFVLGFIKNTKVLMFIVGVMLSLIVLVIFFSHIRNTIKKRNETHIDDKVFFVYGIINIVLIIGLLGIGIYARSHDLNMPKINFLYNIFYNTEEDKEIIEQFIGQVQLKILEDQSTIENYTFPEVITDVNDAAYDEYVPDEINLQLNEDGAITGGTITYRGIVYHYDGENIKVE